MSCIDTALALPPDLLKALGNEDFKIRQDGQNELLAWARLHREAAMGELLVEYRSSKDPEVRERCLAVLKELVTDQYLTEGAGFLGIEWAYRPMPVQGREKPAQAVVVTRVSPGAPADAAGLVAGDLILRVDGKGWPADPGPEDFKNEIAERKPGTKLKLEILRDQKEIKVEVMLTRRPTNRELMGFAIPGMDPAAERQAAIDDYFKEWLNERKPLK